MTRTTRPLSLSLSLSAHNYTQRRHVGPAVSHPGPTVRALGRIYIHRHTRGFVSSQIASRVYVLEIYVLGGERAALQHFGSTPPRPPTSQHTTSPPAATHFYGECRYVYTYTAPTSSHHAGGEEGGGEEGISWAANARTLANEAGGVSREGELAIRLATGALTMLASREKRVSLP